MDFILSKLMNRTSPIPQQQQQQQQQNVEKKSSDRTTESVNKKDNKKIGDTFQKLNNHSNGNHNENHQLRENSSIISDISEIKNIDDSVIVLNDAPAASDVKNNAEHKALQILHSNLQTNNNSNDENVLQLKDGIINSSVQDEKNETSTSESKIGILRMDNDTKKPNFNSFFSFNDIKSNKSMDYNQLYFEPLDLDDDIDDIDIPIENMNFQENTLDFITENNDKILDNICNNNVVNEISIPVSKEILNNLKENLDKNPIQDFSINVNNIKLNDLIEKNEVLNEAKEISNNNNADLDKNVALESDKKTNVPLGNSDITMKQINDKNNADSDVILTNETSSETQFDKIKSSNQIESENFKEIPLNDINPALDLTNNLNNSNEPAIILDNIKKESVPIESNNSTKIQIPLENIEMDSVASELNNLKEIQTPLENIVIDSVASELNNLKEIQKPLENIGVESVTTETDISKGTQIPLENIGVESATSEINNSKQFQIPLNNIEIESVTTESNILKEIQIPLENIKIDSVTTEINNSKEIKIPLENIGIESDTSELNNSKQKILNEMQTATNLNQNLNEIVLLENSNQILNTNDVNNEISIIENKKELNTISNAKNQIINANNDLNKIPTIENKINLEANSNENNHHSIPAVTNISLNDILMNENQMNKVNNNISAVLSQSSSSQQLCASPQNISNIKTNDIKQENFKQPTTVIATTTSNNKSVNDSVLVITKLNPEQQQQQQILKNSEENINPFDTRRSGDVSSLFSTPDSVSPDGTFTEASLPDIINTLPNITISGPTNDSFDISILANHLNSLNVNVTEEDSNNLNATITKSSGSPSNISSDDELFAECESFPVSANNSSTDFCSSKTNETKTEKNSNINTTLTLKEDDVKNVVNELSSEKFNKSEISQINNIDMMKEFVENQPINELKEIQNTNLSNCQITSLGNEAVNFNVNDLKSIEPNEIEVIFDKTKNKVLNDEAGTLQKILKEKSPEDSLENLAPIDHKEVIENESKEINDKKDSNQLNVSSQWTEIVSSMNSNEQENLDNSHIELLNTSPQEIKITNSENENIVEKNLSFESEANKCIKEQETVTTENILEEQNNVNIMDTDTKLPSVELNKTTGETQNNTFNSNLSNSRNSLNDMERTNICQNVPPATYSAELNKTTGETQNNTFNSNLSNSRNSLNDIEITNAYQNIPPAPTYSLNVTMECNDVLLNKTQDIETRNSISPLNQTRDISSPLPTNEQKTILKEMGMEEISTVLNETCNIVQPINVHQNNSILPSYNIENEISNINNEKLAIARENLNTKLDSFKNSQFMDLKSETFTHQQTEINVPQAFNITNTIDFSKISNRNTSSNEDFYEPMEVDIQSPDFESQNQFEELNNTFKKPENLTFDEPPIGFGKTNNNNNNNNDEFKSIGYDDNIDLVFQSCDFEYLLKRGNNTVNDIRKDSLLLKFDPLLGKPVPVTNLQHHSTIQEEEDVIIPNTSTNISIRATEKEKIAVTTKPQIEIDNNLLINVPTTKVTTVESNKKIGCKKQILPTRLAVNKKDIISSTVTSAESPLLEEFERLERRLQLEERGSGDAGVNKMSVDVIQNNIKIENDLQSNENINSINSNEKHDMKMEDLEKKIKNEVLKTEDVEKKLKDAEQREEALLKRITEKDKTIAKMGGVIEAYEKAIAELIAEKEQTIQNYEKQMEEIKSERDLNKQHLESLESTFTDLHAKYERSKQLLAKLKASEEELQAEKKRNLENLGLQEQRYEKMKNHAMQQLEIANNKLEHLTKNHQLEITKLKALLKKEEIAKSSINEQLIQKSKENEELVKICEELINGGSTS